MEHTASLIDNSEASTLGSIWTSRYEQTRLDIVGGRRCNFEPNYIRRRLMRLFLLSIPACLVVWILAIVGFVNVLHSVASRFHL